MKLKATAVDEIAPRPAASRSRRAGTPRRRRCGRRGRATCRAACAFDAGPTMLGSSIGRRGEEIDSAQRAVAVVHQVLAQHAAAERPADQHRLAQPLGGDDGVHLVGPALAVLVAGRIGRLVRTRRGRADRRRRCGNRAPARCSVCRLNDSTDCAWPWISRISGPAGLPHSHTDTATPSGVVTRSNTGACVSVAMGLPRHASRRAFCRHFTALAVRTPAIKANREQVSARCSGLMTDGSGSAPGWAPCLEFSARVEHARQFRREAANNSAQSRHCAALQRFVDALRSACLVS